MAGFQEIAIIGNVGYSPELKYSQSGVAICTFSVAVNETWTDKATGEKQENTTWYRITAWRGLAETVNAHVTKGMQVFIKGKPSVHAYMSKGENPEPRASLEITAFTIQFLSRGAESDDDMDQRTPYEHEESAGPDWGYDD